MRIGRYEIDRELGRGAMGIVYLAADPTIGRPVAIKTVNISMLSDPGQEAVLRDRLIREARSAALLSHPGIVKVYDAVEQDGATCLVMEYVEGQPLSVLLGAKAVDRALFANILQQVGAALDYAHGAGVIHRDVKPANVLVTRDRLAKVTDFGLARVSGRKTTYAAGFLGTPGYMAPEQIKDEAVNGQTDQFALAVMAYEYFTGRKPFDAEAITSLIFKILQDPMPSTGLGDAVDSVFGRALAKDPAQRFPSCSGFVAELQEALQRGLVLGAGARYAAPTGAPSPHQTVTVQVPVASKGSSSWRPVLAGVMTFVLLGGGWYALQRRSASSESAVARRGEASPPAPPAAPLDPPPPASGGTPAARAVSTGEPARPAAPVAEARSAARDIAPKPRETAKPEPVKPVEAAKAEPSPPKPAPEPAPPRIRMRVVTQPPGAVLVFDGNPEVTCVSPCEKEFLAGAHTVRAMLTGHREVTSPFDLPGPGSLAIVLERQQGVIAFDESLRGATIFLDGQEASVRPPAELQVPAGDHQVRLAAPNGTVFFERTLTVKHQGRIVVKGPQQSQPAQQVQQPAAPLEEPVRKRRPPTLFKKRNP
ncbi:MAG: serine/threonine protein kinase [Bryobacterales bacterium]|nr:serine/threonine protein kinase [Bryobacterales bacterium]